MTIDSPQAIATFFAMVATDYAWAQYTMSAAAKQPKAAAVWAMAILGMGAIVTRAYVDNALMLVPAMAGAFVGTYIAVGLERDA